MKIAHITTINALDKIESEILFCLAPYCKNESYKKFFKNSHKFIILDNSVAEDELISDEELVNLAIELNVSEIIIPDVIGDYEKTKKKRDSFLNKYTAKLAANNIKIMSVVQGNNLNEYEKCLKEIHSDMRIDTIGIPFRIEFANFYNKTKEENHMLNRLVFLNHMNFFKSIHCLGCNLPSELKYLNYIKQVRSCDSKLMSRYGLNEKIFEFTDKEKPKQKLFLDKDLTDKQIKITIKNIEKLNEELKW
jgi:hypothetical protein